MSDTNALITQLTKTATSVTPVNLQRHMRFALLGLFVASTAWVLAQGVRGYVWEAMPLTPYFVFLSLWLVLISGSLLFAAKFATPESWAHTRTTKLLLTGAGTIVLLKLIAGFGTILNGVTPMTTNDIQCLMSVLLVGGLFSAINLYLLRKSAPLNPALLGALAGLGGAGFAMLARLIICPSLAADKLFLYHYLPLIAVILFSAYIAHRLFKW